MPITARYVFIASMDVDADKEAVFNEVYDAEHIPSLLSVPGVRSATRPQGRDVRGEHRRRRQAGDTHRTGLHRNIRGRQPGSPGQSAMGARG